MRKKIILLPLAMSLAVSVFAQGIEFDQAGLYYEVNSVSDKTLTLLGAVSDSCNGDFVLPVSVTYNGEEYKISDIVEKAFFGCNGMTSIIIPESVIRIGDGAFMYCQSLTDVIINGTPHIGVNAFDRCPNIEAVHAISSTPGEIALFNPFVLDGTHVVPGGNASVNYVNSEQLGRTVTEISGSNPESGSWKCSFSMPYGSVPAASYKASIGILPSPDGKPCYFHPVIYATVPNGKRYIHDPIRYDTIIDSRGRMRLVPTAEYISNDPSKYDVITISEELQIPENAYDLTLELSLDCNEKIREHFSDMMVFDRLSFEPIDTVFALESYAGPFVESVFNNATLYVPEGAVDTYGSADGWKLFKSIVVDPTAPTNVYRVEAPVQETIIYDLYGRKLSAPTGSGIFIINEKKVFVAE